MIRWCFYGSLVVRAVLCKGSLTVRHVTDTPPIPLLLRQVQILQYTAALRTTLRKERVWQVWAVAAVFVLSSLQTAVNGALSTARALGSTASEIDHCLRCLTDASAVSRVINSQSLSSCSLYYRR